MNKIINFLPKKKHTMGGENRKYSKGFSLIEMLVVIFVVGIGLIGALSFFNININNQFEAKNELIAAGLAQEGPELVRNIVDYNYLNEDPKWYKEIANSSDGSSSCDWLDLLSLVDHKCETSDTNKKISVCIDTSSNRYYQCPNTLIANRIPTIFFRKVEVKGENVNGLFEMPYGIDLENGDCLKVITTVGWPNSDANCAADINTCPRKTTSSDIICKPRE